MAIRIDGIKVNRDGPLKKDFHLEPRDVNLIYGHNETGKSYIVEAIINLLFRTGRKPAIDWNLRSWDLAGSIVVSGLDDKPVTFTRTGKKLDDYWGEEKGLPQDFSRLLVVKEGETLLADEKDGVGRDILKNYLSGEGLLDNIGKRISTILQKAKVKDGQIISSKKMGEIKDRAERSDELKSLNTLLNKAENDYTSGVVYALQQKQKDITDRIEGLEKAKRYHAHCLQTKINSLNQKRERLPSEEELSRIESAVAVYEEKKMEFVRKSNKVAELRSAVASYQWAVKALESYKEITARQIIAKPKVVYVVLAFIFFAGMAVAGFLNLLILMAICTAGSLAFLLVYLLRMQHALISVGSSKELERLKKEFEIRYRSELTDRAMLEAKVDELGKDFSQYTSLQDRLKELIPDLDRKEGDIKGDLKKFVDNELPPQKWRSTIRKLRSRLSGINHKINSLDMELRSLNVSKEELLYQDPGIKWDSGIYEELKGAEPKLAQKLKDEQQNLQSLKSSIAQETRLDIGTDWGELISALHKKCDNVAGEYRKITADILAKIQVNTVIQEFRKEENVRIAEGLASELLAELLHAITGCYKCIRYDEDNGLVIINDDDEEYPLKTVSTGAKEQAFLAMRMGFSSLIMKGETAFLVLDDAFQHSDWPRRTNLMDQVLRLVGSGWQIFYFTMDDHIRDLFLKAGEKLGDRFKCQELC
jgi:uncharacterized protein YhaN